MRAAILVGATCSVQLAVSDENVHTVSPFSAVLSTGALQGKSQLRVAKILSLLSQLRVAILKITEA
jgi:hypothetical protein